MKNRITLGLSSIILILLILCLSVFSLLSLSDAKNARSFAERRAASVQAYYRADSAGQEFLRNLQDGTEGRAFAGSGTLVHEISMPSGQSLHMEIDQTDLSVLSYYVYNSEEYEIDSRLPVWGGSQQ